MVSDPPPPLSKLLTAYPPPPRNPVGLPPDTAPLTACHLSSTHLHSLLPLLSLTTLGSHSHSTLHPPILHTPDTSLISPLTTFHLYARLHVRLFITSYRWQLAGSTQPVISSGLRQLTGTPMLDTSLTSTTLSLFLPTQLIQHMHQFCLRDSSSFS
jgi:hypothetical protein